MSFKAESNADARVMKGSGGLIPVKINTEVMDDLVSSGESILVINMTNFKLNKK
jgi:hypothetical protein